MPRKTNFGRPTTLTDKVLEEVEALAPRCIFIENVAAMLGVSPICFRAWIREGKNFQQYLEEGLDHNEITEHQGRCIQLYMTLSRIDAERESKLLALAEEAAATDWRAVWKMLEAVKPSRYGSQKHVLNEIRKNLKELETKLSQATGEAKQS